MIIESKKRHVWQDPRFVLEAGRNVVERVPPQCIRKLELLERTGEIRRVMEGPAPSFEPETEPDDGDLDEPVDPPPPPVAPVVDGASGVGGGEPPVAETPAPDGTEHPPEPEGEDEEEGEPPGPEDASRVLEQGQRRRRPKPR